MAFTCTESEATVTHTRGSLLTFFRSTLMVTLNGGRYEVFLGRLSPEARAFMQRTPSAEEWVPTTILGEIHEAQRDLPRADTRKVRAEMMAEQQFPPAFLSQFPPGDPRPLLQLLPDMWPQHQRGGRVCLDEVDREGAQLSLWVIYPYQEYQRDVITAYLQQTLVLLGAKDAKVDYLGPGEADPHYRHRYWLKWTLPE